MTSERLLENMALEEADADQSSAGERESQPPVSPAVPSTSGLWGSPPSNTSVERQKSHNRNSQAPSPSTSKPTTSQRSSGISGLFSGAKPGNPK